MKICLLTPRFPFPENGGDVLRINNIARYLKSQGHELILVSFSEHNIPDFDGDAKNLYDYVYTKRRNRAVSFIYSFLYLMCGKPIQCGYYNSLGYKRLLKKIIAKFSPDLYISHLLRMTPYLEALGVTDKTIVEMTDALSKTYGLSLKANGSVLKRIIYTIEQKGIKKYERHVIDVFPKVVLVSQEDVDLLKTSTSKNLCLHTNGVWLNERISATYDKDKICFVGNMRTLQNQDAVLYFVNEVLPKILNAKPNAKFYIVGAEPPQRIKSLASSNIVVTGYVDDLSSYIADACVAVAPIRVAAGIQNKVLVAMGHEIPVVVTSLISRAIPELVDGKNSLIRDKTESIAQACIELMTDAELRENIARNGYDVVKQNYSWQSKLAGYEIMPT